VPAKKGHSSDEDTSSREGEEGDGVAVGALGCGGSGGGVVSALGAALGVELVGSQEAESESETGWEVALQVFAGCWIV